MQEEFLKYIALRCLAEVALCVPLSEFKLDYSKTSIILCADLTNEELFHNCLLYTSPSPRD